ncbi:MAG: 30S ribosomal protein S16 [Candidatus Paceibacterota bacterium]|jgi:small subunit ribosomal protein S16
MLKIRLQRVGRVNVPTFRVVLTDSKNSTKSGKFLEILGTYDPVHDVKEVKADRIKHWMSKGAQVSDTLHNFLIHKKLISGKKVNKLPKKSPIAKEGSKVEASAPVAPAAAPTA